MLLLGYYIDIIFIIDIIIKLLWYDIQIIMKLLILWYDNYDIIGIVMILLWYYDDIIDIIVI